MRTQEREILSDPLVTHAQDAPARAPPPRCGRAGGSPRRPGVQRCGRRSSLPAALGSE